MPRATRMQMLEGEGPPPAGTWETILHVVEADGDFFQLDRGEGEYKNKYRFRYNEFSSGNLLQLLDLMDEELYGTRKIDPQSLCFDHVRYTMSTDQYRVICDDLCVALLSGRLWDLEVDTPSKYRREGTLHYDFYWADNPVGKRSCFVRVTLEKVKTL